MHNISNSGNDMNINYKCTLRVQTEKVVYMNILQTIYKSAKIRCVIAVCLCLWAAVLLQLAVENVFAKKVDITEAFSIEDNVTIKNCSVESTARLDKDGQYFTAETLLNLLEKMSDTDSNIRYSEVKYRNEPVPCYYLEYESSVWRVSMTLSKPAKNVGAYLHLVITDFSEMKDYNACRETIETYYGKEGLNLSKTSYIIYSGIDALITGKMSPDECNKLTDKIFSRIGADTVCEGYDNYYTRYGYSDSLKNSHNFHSGEGKNVNFQIAYSYNETADATEVMIGTPFINGGY